MICQATYDSLEAIPEALREEFEQKNGKWQLKSEAIPGVGPLFNSALAANESKAVGQVKTRNERIRVLEEELNTAKDKLAVLDTPGNKVLSKDDAASFDAYVALGTPKEIKTKLAQNEELSGKVAKFETGDALAKVAQANGLGDVKINPEVLTDWLTSADNKGVTVFVKTVEQTDAKGAKTNVEVPHVRIEKNEDGVTKVSERELLPFAKEVMPEWKYTALIATGEEASGGGKKTATKAAAGAGNGSGVKIPDLSSARKPVTEGSDKKRPIDLFNEQRAAKANPFAKNGATGPLAAMAPQTRDK